MTADEERPAIDLTPRPVREPSKDLSATAIAIFYVVAGTGLVVAATAWTRVGGWDADAECRRSATACGDVGPSLPVSPVLWAVTLVVSAGVVAIAWAVRPTQVVPRIIWSVLVALAVCVANWHGPIWAVAAGIATTCIIATPRRVAVTRPASERP